MVSKLTKLRSNKTLKQPFSYNKQLVNDFWDVVFNSGRTRLYKSYNTQKHFNTRFAAEAGNGFIVLIKIATQLQK